MSFPGYFSWPTPARPVSHVRSHPLGFPPAGWSGAGGHSGLDSADFARGTAGQYRTGPAGCGPGPRQSDGPIGSEPGKEPPRSDPGPSPLRPGPAGPLTRPDSVTCRSWAAAGGRGSGQLGGLGRSPVGPGGP
eukprot:767305-Hanusia_phi.AAC.12